MKTLNIVSVQVLLTQHADQVSVITDLPEGKYPFSEKQAFDATMARDQGIAWVQKYLEVEPKVINVR